MREAGLGFAILFHALLRYAVRKPVTLTPGQLSPTNFPRAHPLTVPAAILIEPAATRESVVMFAIILLVLLPLSLFPRMFDMDR